MTADDSSLLTPRYEPNLAQYLYSELLKQDPRSCRSETKILVMYSTISLPQDQQSYLKMSQ